MSTIVYYVVPFFLLTSLLELGALRKRPELAGYENRDTWTSRFPGIGNVIVAAHANRPSSTHDNLSTALRQLLTTPLPGVLFGAPLARLGFAPEIIATAHEISRIYPFGLHTERVGRPAPGRLWHYEESQSIQLRDGFVSRMARHCARSAQRGIASGSAGSVFLRARLAPRWKWRERGGSPCGTRSPWDVVIVIEVARTHAFVSSSSN
jgi:hypothetical protein